jgi:trans-aconitate 2-methyltransferase
MTESPHQGQVAGTRWNPAVYAKFADQRSRPAFELLARVPISEPRIVIDLGCGSGDATRAMAEQWPNAAVVGLDNSPEMLEKANQTPGRVRWMESDIRDWRPEVSPDLIYSNATLQWIDDHQLLFPRLMADLAPGGCLAVQMPLSWSLPSHRLMRVTLQNGGSDGGPLGADLLRRAVGRNWVHSADVYYRLLNGPAKDIDIWETEYLQVLEGDDPVLDWVSGTGLRPILNGLGEPDRSRFLDEYRRRLRVAYPAESDGRTLYPFRRLFIIAIKSH